MMNKRKAVIGFSGGVDSTAAALLLSAKGFEVTGAYLDVTGGNNQGRDEACSVAREIGIDMVSVDVSREFSRTVIADFCSEYEKGRTPSPCVTCNPSVKFKHLADIADARGAQFVASGHYAKVRFDLSEGRYFINQAESAEKDQSYMLYRLGEEVLSRLILPLGDFYSKTEVRNLVLARGVKNAGAKDSLEICFIPRNMHYTEFLTARGCRSEEGDFVDECGKTIGRHRGIAHYTVGQRKNLGAAFGRPMYVLKIDPVNNRVTLGGNDGLFSCEVLSKNNFFTKSGNNKMPDNYEGLSVTAKVRYGAAHARATIKRVDDDTVMTVFEKPQRAAAPGQSIVFYKDGKVVGGGVIDGVLRVKT